MNRIEILKTAVISALNSNTPDKVTNEIMSIEGMSGATYKRFANRLLSNDIVKNYLEIGVWKGSTSIAALHGNHHRLKYTVIDNFSQFGGPKEEFIKNWKTHNGDEPNLIDEDCFLFDPIKKGISDIDVYFYDGEHGENDHYLALKHYYNSMASSFIFMVDDWSWDQVKNGTNKALKELKLKVHYQQEFGGNSDGSGWWNGCGIFVLEK